MRAWPPGSHPTLAADRARFLLVQIVEDLVVLDHIGGLPRGRRALVDTRFVLSLGSGCFAATRRFVVAALGD
ncbi:MAG: hypothetical protein DME07_19945 [Candidatus Rokuibacteriota bacterium]|nr:MAG: hypothetical protein DME07_19945 [Candidatus Rokubacteria bacterium]